SERQWKKHSLFPRCCAGRVRNRRRRYVLQKFPRIRTGRFAVQIDRRSNRKPNKERRFVRIVIQNVDPDRQTLHDFNEITCRILRWQKREGRTSTIGETRDTPFKTMFAAVHVDLKFNLLADAKIAQLCFLEIRVYPDVPKRANGHQALPDLD